MATQADDEREQRETDEIPTAITAGTVNKSGRFTIPADVRTDLGLEAGSPIIVEIAPVR